LVGGGCNSIVNSNGNYVSGSGNLILNWSLILYTLLFLKF
jgi:hypothetical protein